MLKAADLEALFVRLRPAIEESGLSIGQLHVDVVDADTLNALASYSGMPSRIGHWSFGKVFHQMRTAHDYRMTQIYELVVNNRPAYAFMDRTTSQAQALMILAHVVAHVDFFRHNRLFDATPSDMVTRMARHRHQFQELTCRYGVERVESLIDAAMVLMDFAGEHPRIPMRASAPDDVMGFVMQNAPQLENWERDALATLYGEARYFWPQQLTKVSNEGYATFWHQKILQRAELSAAEAWDVARLHAAVVQTTRPQLNPYRLGLTLYQQLWLDGGLRQVFEARSQYDDLGLIRRAFQEEMVERTGLVLYRPQEPNPEPRPGTFTTIRSQLLRDLENGGIPHLRVQREDSLPDLVLQHRHDGRDLDFSILPFAMGLVASRLWKGRVRLHTLRQKVPHIVSHDGTQWEDSVG